jgi:murein DD-endopeptidase MepM/ murein hydrolase activator NlpD
MSWLWPIPSVKKSIPGKDTQGFFGAVRKHDIHTGVDIYCNPNCKVIAVESGVVKHIENFTGPSAGSPWWRETKAVWVEGDSGVVVYGELDPIVNIGDSINAGDTIGYVQTVLANDKGLPMTMLHIELYTKGMTETVWWRHEEEKPESLLDPTEFLINSI